MDCDCSGLKITFVKGAKFSGGVVGLYSGGVRTEMCYPGVGL